MFQSVLFSPPCLHPIREAPIQAHETVGNVSQIDHFSAGNDSGRQAPGTRIIGVGLMPTLVRFHDWNATSLGPIQEWSEVLISNVNQVLQSPLPATLSWGAELIFFYNEAAISTLERKHPGALGQSSRNVLGEIWHMVGPSLEACYTQGKTTVLENVFIPTHQDGRMRGAYWTHHFIPIYEQGAIVGVYDPYHNTTDAFRAKHERTVSADQLTQVLNATTDGVMSLDRNWHITYMNPRAAEIVKSTADVLGMSVWRAFPRLDHEGSPFPEPYSRAMHEGIPARFEAFYPAPLNVWVDLQVRPTQDGVVLLFRDITAQKQNDEQLRKTALALKESEQELRWTLELSAQIRWTADSQGHIVDLSPRWAEITGRSREDLLEKGWHKVPHPEDLPRILEAWNWAIENGEALDIEHRMRMASGLYCWVRMRAFARRNHTGAVIKLYGIIEDIDERKRAEAALLQNEKLAAIGRLASSIAHEINNPLEAVTNLLYLVRSKESTPNERDHYLDSADRELRRVSMIANQTLRFHRQSSSPTTVFLQELVDSSLLLYRGRLLNSSIAVEKRDRAPKPVTCFDGEIRQVISNLMGNAIEAMQDGGRLSIHTREATCLKTGRKGVTLAIADTGCGMTPETIKQIFAPFFTTKEVSGTGLGLWVSSEIIERHHGKLLVRSSVRKEINGTAFTLFLPYDVVGRSPFKADEQ